jgi:hypothetical protein
LLRSQASSKATRSTEGQIISPSTLIQLTKPDKDTLCINLFKHTTFYPYIIRFQIGGLSFCYALENRSYAESKDNPMENRSYADRKDNDNPMGNRLNAESKDNPLLHQPITENTPPAVAYHDKKQFIRKYEQQDSQEAQNQSPCHTTSVQIS